MFGRSGQMFPRRAYHDAIYEEEYGSETDEECCRGRGLSAILCWFLSVIILIGLAASVVLTVFFVLKSRNFLPKNNPEDLNIVYDHGNGFKILPTTSTMDLDFNFTSSTPSKGPAVGDNEEAPMTTSSIEATARTTTMTATSPTTTTTTMLPTTTRLTTRKYYSDTTGRVHDTIDKTTPMPPTTDGNSMFKFLFNTIKTFQNDADDLVETVSSVEGDRDKGPAEELLSNESNDRYVPPITQTFPPPTSFRQSSTIKTMTATSPILFTLPPLTSTSMMNQHYPSNKRNSASTKHPERTSFSQEENTATTNYKQYDHSQHYIPPGSSEEVVTTSPAQEVTLRPSLMKPDSEESDEINYQAEESTKLTKMLIDQIPPHGDTMSTTMTTSVPNTTVKEDLLARIIKNLQPKWNKSKIPETTTNRNDEIMTTLKTRNRYVDIQSSRESNKNEAVKRFKYQRGTTALPPPSTIIIITPDSTVVTTKADSTSIFTTTASTAASSSQSEAPIKIVKAPDFVSKNNQKDDFGSLKDLEKDGNSEFLDILVGSDDHKTLVTKETEDGVITSAILPPWFDSNSTDTVELNNKTMRFLTANESAEDVDDDSPNDHSKPKTDFDILLNLFSNTPLPNTANRSTQPSSHPQSETYVSEMSAEDTKKSQHLKNLEEQLKPFFSSPSKDVDVPVASGTQSQQQVSPANNAFHYGSSDGTTNIYGYYPEEDLDESESVDQLDIEIDPSHRSRNASGGSHYQDQGGNNSDDQNDHVIDIAYDPKVRPEIVIEPEAGEGEVEGDDGDGDYTDNDTYSDIVEPMAAGSDIHDQRVYAPPPMNMIENQNKDQHSQDLVGPSGTGSGIRHPMTGEEKEDDLSALANEPQPQIDWSMKSNHHVETTGQGQGQPEGDSQRTPHELSLEETEEQEVDEEPNNENANENDNENANENDNENSEANHKNAMSALEDVDDILDAGHEDYMERKPVVDIDESLYPSKEEIHVSTTTEKPKVNVYEVYSEPYRAPTASSNEVSVSSTQKPVISLTADDSHNKDGTETDSNDGSDNATTKSGFVPPEPINFHENTYTFESQSSSEYHSKGGWRPVLFDRRGQESNVHHNRAHLDRMAHKKHDFVSTSMQPPQFQSTVRFDPVTTPIHSPTTTPSSSQPSEEYEDGDEAASNEQWYSGQGPSGSSNTNNNHASEKAMSFKPSVRLPVTPPQHMSSQMPNSLPPRVKFPENQLQQQQQQQQQHQQQMPMQQQQTQHSMQNSIIDRSKYLNRPAPPPILMRRQPPFNLPFKLPHRKRNSSPPSGPPVRNFPRGPPQYTLSGGTGPGHGHFSHPENGNLMAHSQGMRHAHESFPNQPQSAQSHSLSSPGGVHWPGEDQQKFTRTRITNPLQMSRRPSNG